MHRARVAVKRARAGLRVLRPALGERRYARRNDLLRAAARSLSALRDAEVLARTAAELAARGEAGASRELARRARLARRRRGALARAAALLSRALGAPAPRGLGPRRAAEAVRRDYERALRRLEAARRRGGDEDFHAWRRAAKALLYELELFGRAPRGLRSQAKALKRLGSALGRDHDAGALAAALERESLSFGEPEPVERLALRARREQAASRRRASRLGRRAFRPAPRAVARRVRRALREAAGRS